MSNVRRLNLAPRRLTLDAIAGDLRDVRERLDCIDTVLLAVVDPPLRDEELDYRLAGALVDLDQAIALLEAAILERK
jgi:hypothetical protein